MVEQAVAAGVTRLIAVGVDLDRSATAVSLSHAYEEVWAGVGHHPLEIPEPDLGAMRQPPLIMSTAFGILFLLSLYIMHTMERAQQRAKAADLEPAPAPA